MIFKLESKFGLKTFNLWMILILVLAILLPTGSVTAQTDQPDGPVYIVQEGDSLWNIAIRFGVSMDALEKANGITDPNQLALGAKLVIPGLEGIQGVLTTETVGFGETLRTLSRRYNIPVDTLIRLNHLTSPAELYAGASLVVPEQDTKVNGGQRAALAQGQSLLELAVLRNANPWSFILKNKLPGSWGALPGDVLSLPSEGAPSGPDGLPDAITEVDLKPLPMVQGKTTVVKVVGEAGLTLSGSLAGNELHFFPLKDGVYVALQGIYAMADPGLYPLTLNGTLPDGTSFAFTQPIFVRSGDYPYDPELTVNPETIDPSVTKPEDAQWKALAAPITPEKLWSGKFQSPLAPPFNDCWPSRFGNRRAYNGGPYNSFHTGLDFCGGVGTEIHAPAAGVVVFAGPLTVRGNATMIDHGWGVYTGYMHQSKIFVHPGDHVEAGQVIGLVGGTGRVTGPHLHFEMFVGGLQVDPMDWLQQTFP